MKSFQKGGFTLVELIVVLVILSLLSTIGFVTYSQYLGLVRDTNRVSNMAALSDGLEMHSADNSLPLPENKVEIKSNGELIARQGDAGPAVLEAVDFVRGGKDPQSGEYMSYYLTRDKKYFQLMTFLEGDIDDIGFQVITSTYAATSQSERAPIVTGKKLGILTDENNVPIHRVQEIQTAGYLDIATSTGTYISHFRDRGSLRGTNDDLELLVDLSKNGGKPNNCLTWVLMNPDLTGKQGNYQMTDIEKNQYI
ncbi:MAG: prepilin-type N-terminal cleavage/methylation domain-containing protein [Candidatus Peribacteria bacterium]|nr:MAG: prepilin-type N-terminal cleavage/methylation domain-containing protein [Candidatus Peribacteria bacterium]